MAARSTIAILMSATITLLASIMLTRPYQDGDVIKTTSSLPEEVQQWMEMGNWKEVNGGRRVFYIYRKHEDLKQRKTIALIHGFPSSSFDYHKVIDHLYHKYDYDVITHDHVGFGLSDKPLSDYTYSLAEAAENTIALWMSLNITKNVHIVAHDMGDSVTCEILSRLYRGMLPSEFDDFLTGVVFTNGGMNYEQIKFRLTQRIMSIRYLGSYLARLSSRLGLARILAPRQLAEVFSPQSDPWMDVQAITELNEYNGGLGIMDKLIYYLSERPNNEYKWYQALKNISLPIDLVWGSADVVNPLSIAYYIRDHVLGGQGRLKVVEGAGHFVMLEKPQEWVEAVTFFINNF